MKTVPGPLAAALVTGRVEILEAFAAEVRESLTPEGAEGVVELAIEIAAMRRDIFAEVALVRDRVRDARGQLVGLERKFEGLDERLAAVLKDEDPDAAERSILEARRGGPDAG